MRIKVIKPKIIRQKKPHTTKRHQSGIFWHHLPKKDQLQDIQEVLEGRKDFPPRAKAFIRVRRDLDIDTLYKEFLEWARQEQNRFKMWPSK